MKAMHKKIKLSVPLILIAQIALVFLCSCGTASLADKVWAFSQSHPEGFTLDVRTMTEPSEGIAVSYATTQNSHSRNQLGKVVRNALQQDGYVGGWYNHENGLYYFDSTKLFPENALKDAIKFGKENGQHTVFMLSTSTNIPFDGKVAEIVERGTILIGTTGDYRPLSFCEEDGTYWGFGIEVAKEIARRMGVGVEFKKTSWPTLTADVLAEPQRFDLAIGGITITVHSKNEEIPSLIAEGEADVMITEITEAPYYVQTDTRLAAPLLNKPFTHSEIGVLMRKGQEDLLELVNATIRQMKSDGSLRKLHEKYGLVYEITFLM
jgi:ABC-type amino acid transport substrate-binding protein